MRHSLLFVVAIHSCYGIVKQNLLLRLQKGDFYPTKATIGSYCCNLLHPPTVPIDSLHFLSHCGVGNGDIEERGGKGIMKVRSSVLQSLHVS